MLPPRHNFAAKVSARDGSEFGRFRRDAHREAHIAAARTRRQDVFNKNRCMASFSLPNIQESPCSMLARATTRLSLREKAELSDDAVTEEELESLLSVDETSLPCPVCRAPRGVTFANNGSVIRCSQCLMSVPSRGLHALEDWRQWIEGQYTEHASRCRSMPRVLVCPSQSPGGNGFGLRLACEDCQLNTRLW